jgi:quinolinate synthase
VAVMTASMTEQMQDEVRSLATERKAVVLAHNYQVPEVQDVADYVGDSLGLSQQAAGTEADVIVFCGVHFMAETAAVLAPEKTVLIPDLDAGCSLAASIDAEALARWKDENPGAVVVSYVNTTAEVKALSDYCCTSGNARQIIEAVPADREILFLPDMFLGAYLERVTGRKMKIWPGECHVHAGIRPDDVARKLDEHPDAELLIHPECGCASQCMYAASENLALGVRTHVLSTEGMVQRARTSPSREFMVATETGILHRLGKEAPDARFYAMSERAVCRYMKMITLEKLRDSLLEMRHRVTVDPELAARARGAIQRMVEIT